MGCLDWLQKLQVLAVQGNPVASKYRMQCFALAVLNCPLLISYDGEDITSQVALPAELFTLSPDPFILDTHVVYWLASRFDASFKNIWNMKIFDQLPRQQQQCSRLPQPASHPTPNR
jgi:hypothetical protein